MAPRYETIHWPANPDAYGPRAARRPVQLKALIPDAIAELAPMFPSQIVAHVARAERELVSLNRAPNAGHLAPLANRLLHAESVGSSWIEGLRISQRRLARAEAEGARSRDDTAKAVLGNVAAMERLVEAAHRPHPLHLEDVLAAHRALMAETPNPTGAGELRTEQNWVGGNSFTPAGASFVPPPPQYVPHLMSDLLLFLERKDIAPVIHAAVAHAQFEAIHPFGDGNGRVGRALIHYVLRRADIAPNCVPPISPVLAAHRDSYVQGLNAFAEGHMSEWLDLFAQSIETAASCSERLLVEMAALQDRWRERAHHPRRDSTAEALIVALSGQPVVTVEMAARITGRSVQAANTALAALEAAAIVKGPHEKTYRREFEAPEALDLVTRFEQDLGTARSRHTTRGLER